MRLTKMTHDLLIGIVALIAAASLFIVGLPTRHGESPRFLQCLSGDRLDIFRVGDLAGL
jgi:hypothetical protein